MDTICVNRVLFFFFQREKFVRSGLASSLFSGFVGEGLRGWGVCCMSTLIEGWVSAVCKGCLPVPFRLFVCCFCRGCGLELRVRGELGSLEMMGRGLVRGLLGCTYSYEESIRSSHCKCPVSMVEPVP